MIAESRPTIVGGASSPDYRGKMPLLQPIIRFSQPSIPATSHPSILPSFRARTDYRGKMPLLQPIIRFSRPSIPATSHPSISSCSH